MRALGFVTAILALTSCSMITKAVGWERNGTFTMVDVTGQSRSAAESSVRAYGIQGSISVVDNYTCDDPKVKEGFVCYTSPRAGNATSSRISVTLYLRPKETPSFLMPDVRGKTADEAKAMLIALGQNPERFQIEEMRGWLDECEPGRVCRQSPEPGQQTWVTIAKWLEIAPAQRPERPRSPPPPRDVTTAPEDKPADKPKEKPPEPIF